MNQSLDPNIRLLNLSEIAAWQISNAPAQKGKIIADLPALQRGAVWKVKQIEELWDSILRGFPVGSFIITPPNDRLKRQNYKFQTTNQEADQTTHLLLDGQQRATAIALAFDDIWTRRDEDAKGALWVDLSLPPQGGQVMFNFRVLTRSHPWGYRQSNSDETLSSSAMRSALQTYQAVQGIPDKRPEDLNLWQTWPWDSKAPIPVAPLIVEILSNQFDIKGTRHALWQQLKSLDFLSAEPKFQDNDGAPNENIKRILNEQRRAIQSAFENPESIIYRRLDQLINAFKRVLDAKTGYRIPALILDISPNDDVEDEISTETDKWQAEKDAIELLFVRVNSAGTPLAGEELAYSLLKAEWPDIAQWMQDLPNKPALPSRIAALCVRLVLARNERLTGDRRSHMPEMPTLADFRRLLRGDNQNHKEFSSKLLDFINNEAKNCFANAWKFLTEPTFGLLPAQVVDIAKNSPDVYLLLLRWLDRLAAMKIELSNIDTEIHRRTLGFLTAVAWFAPEKSKTCASLWSELEADIDTQKLPNRFNSTRYKQACRLTERATLKMIPLPTPDQLQALCWRFIGNDGRIIQTKNKATIHFPKGGFWQDKNWWYNQFSPALAENLESNWTECIKTDENEEFSNYSELSEQIAVHFLDVLWGAKTTILLYAQRQAIKKWFPKFDPSIPEMMEDKNRPWDWDHILPQSYFSGRWGIPQSVKDWGNSIGNLRAWPLEANRADGDATPKVKLSEASDVEQRYGIKDGTGKRKNSVVNDTLDWPHWQECVPTDESGEVVTKYLSNDQSYPDHRGATITAIVLRFVELYRHWYDELKLGKLV